MGLTQTKNLKRRVSRVFIDSSVLIAAAISGKGNARELLKLGIINFFDLYISPEVLKESERNILLKAPNSIKDFYIFKKSLENKVVRSDKKQILKVAEIIEVKDAPIVAGAMQAKADFLVTYDRKHLLQYKKEIEENFKVRVVTPDEAVKSL